MTTRSCGTPPACGGIPEQIRSVAKRMLTIAVDPHKQTHSAVAVDKLGVELTACTQPARRAGFEELLARSRSLAAECV